MKERYVIVTIDTITELFKDYCGPSEIPADAKPVRLMLKPTDKGKIAILMESGEWKENQAPLKVKFDLRRTYAV